MPRATDVSTPAAPAVAPFRITATSEAAQHLKGLLATVPSGQGLRIWVETGIHPQVKMMLDRPNERDLRLEVAGVPVFVDGLSQRFLVDAEIQWVRAGGQEGFHVSGPNVPGSAPAGSEGTTAPAAGPAGPFDRVAVEGKIRAALKQIYDPEIPMNLVDLGLIYGIDWHSDSSITLRMSLTSVGCPATEQIMHEVDRAVRAASGLPEVKVEIVWDPPWTPERMSSFAKRQFGYA